MIITQAPADPGAIDLEAIRRRYALKTIARAVGSICVGDINELIAAVEAVQDQLAQQSIDLVNAGDDNEELRERVVELANVLKLASENCPRCDGETTAYVRPGHPRIPCPQCAPWRAVLAATPEEVMKRVAAWKICETVIRERLQDIRFLHLTVQRERELSKALDVLKEALN